MKKVLFLVGLGAMVYYFMNASTHSNQLGSADSQVVLYTHSTCGKPCRDAEKFLDRRVAYSKRQVDDSEQYMADYRSSGGTGTVPRIIVGQTTLPHYNASELMQALAENVGTSALTSKERDAFKRNFDSSGNAQLVMYSTKQCGYCTKARRYFVENNIGYTEYYIDQDSGARRSYDALMGTGTPLLYYGARRASGWGGRKTLRALGI